MIKRVLVPIDFSPVSNKAIERAVALANQCQAALTIFHVIDINTQVDIGPASELMGRLWREASMRMGRVAASLSGRVNAQTLIEEGLPREAISLKSRDFDLVILGKAPLPSSWKHFSKHTVQGVLEGAACPVLLV